MLKFESDCTPNVLRALCPLKVHVESVDDEAPISPFPFVTRTAEQMPIAHYPTTAEIGGSFLLPPHYRPDRTEPGAGCPPKCAAVRRDK